MISIFLKIILLLIACALLWVWIALNSNTSRWLSRMSLETTHKTGLGFARANLGALYLSVFVMTVLFLCTSIEWAYPLIVIVLAILLGRLIGFCLEESSKLLIYASLIEAVSLAILLLFVSGLVPY